MMDISGLLNQMVILFVIILIGYVAAKAKVMTPTTNKQLSTLITMLINPLQLLSTSFSGVRPLSTGDALLLTGIALAFYAVSIVVALLLSRSLDRDERRRKVYEFLFIFSNVTFIGFPVVEALLGEGYKFYITVFTMAFQLVCWTYGVSLMSGEKMRFNLKLFTRPMIVAAIITYAVYFSGLKVPEMLYKITNTVGSMTTPLAMLIIGCSLAQLPLKRVFLNGKMYLLAAVKLIVMPIAGYFILHPLLKDPAMLAVSVVVLAMPAATTATILSYQYGADDKLASSGVFITTLLSMVTIPVIMSILF